MNNNRMNNNKINNNKINNKLYKKRNFHNYQKEREIDNNTLQ